MYIQHGFTLMLKNGRELPHCVVCFKVLSDQSMKPSLLKRHLSGCHPELVVNYVVSIIVLQIISTYILAESC